jgi:hypothetical protein
MNEFCPTCLGCGQIPVMLPGREPPTVSTVLVCLWCFTPQVLCDNGTTRHVETKEEVGQAYAGLVDLIMLAGASMPGADDA